MTPGIDNLVRTTITDANGEYLFNSLLPGTYAIRLTGTPALVIDTANRPQEALRALSGALDAPYIALPRADAQRLSAAVSAALGD